jgi:hypothetical protein
MGDVEDPQRSLLRQPAARAWHHVIPPPEIVRRYFRLGGDSVRIARLAQDDAGAPYLRSPYRGA